MSKSILVILLGNRKDAAVNVQKILTGWGSNIKTRLGIHDIVLNNCPDEGLIIIELVGKNEDNVEICRKLNLLASVKAELVNIKLEN